MGTKVVKQDSKAAKAAEMYLNRKGYYEKEDKPIYSADGAKIGDVSVKAREAIESNKLGSYTPISSNEAKVLNKYIEHENERRAKRSEALEIASTRTPIFDISAAQEKNDIKYRNNPTFLRYNIDPDSFNISDFDKWASQHNYEYRMDGAEGYYTPKYSGGFLGIGGRKLTSEQEDEDFKILEQVAKNNARKELSRKDLGAGYSAVIGVGNGLTSGAADALAERKTKKEYANAGLNPNYYVGTEKMNEKTISSHKIANTLGEFGGSVAQTAMVGEIVGGATGAIKGFSSAPKWVQQAINSGITFGAISAAETEFDGGNAKDVLRNGGINLLGGAVGGAVSGIVGGIGEKILFNKDLQHKVIPEIIRNGLSSAAFAGGKTASTYFLYPKEYRPTAEEMAKDLTVAFAFGAISSGINTMKASRQNKKYLDDLYQKMASDYENMAKANISSKSDVGGINKFAKNAIEYSNVMEAYLTGKEYSTTINGQTYTFTPNKVRLVGQDKYVKSILSELQTIRNGANVVLKDIGTPPTAASAGTATSGLTTRVDVPAIPNKSSTANEIGDIGKNIPTTITNPVALSDSKTNEGVTPTLGSTQSTNTESSPITTNTFTRELDEIANSGAIVEYAPESASGEIKRLENILIAQGADDVSRKEIVSTALEIESALASSDKSIRNAFNNASKITSSAVAEITSRVGTSGAYWKLFGENFKAIPSGNVKTNVSLVTEYANAYAEAMRKNNPEKYSAILMSADGADLSSELPRTILQNTIPTGAKNAGEYALAAVQIKNIVYNIDAQIANERGEIYGTKEADTATPAEEAAIVPIKPDNEKTSLTQSGDVYGVSKSEGTSSALGKRNGKPIRAKKGDWASHDVYWYAPNSKTVIAYSTKSASDLIELMARDNPAMTISEVHDAITYDKEAKKILQAYIDGGFGNSVASEYFGDRRSLATAENTDALSSTPETTGSTAPDKIISQDNNSIRNDVENDTPVIQLIENYSSAVDDIESVSDNIAKDYADKRVAVKVFDNTPEVILDNVEDAKDLKVIINYNKLYLAVRKDGVFKGHYHNLGTETAKRLPEFLNSPDAIIQLGNGRLNLFATVKTKRGNNGIISVELNSTKDINGKYEDYNVVVTMFSSDDKYTQNLILGDGVILKYKREDLSQVNPQLYKWLAIINDKSSDDNIISQDNDTVNTSIRNDVKNDAPKLTDKCELIATKHTKTGDDLWVVTLKDKISSEDYKELSSKVKSVGGYYSKFAKTPDGKAIPGFIFKTKPGENTINVFNDFFNTAEETASAKSESTKITVGMGDDERAGLLNKKSINVVSFDAEKAKALEDIDFDALQQTFKKYAKPIAEKVASDFGILNKSYFNPDIELDFEYSKGSLKESINKQQTAYGDFVKMLSVFSDVISNAVGVETHEDKYKGTIREDTTLKQMYVLASALRDEVGIIPVKLEVKEFNEKANKLYLSVVLTKKENRYLNGNLGQNQLNTAPPAFDISIADLVSAVNPKEGDFLKYFPDSMLDSKQIESKNKALAKDAEKIEKLTKALNSQPESDIIEENAVKEGAKNDESQSPVLARESEPDGGRLRTGASGNDTESAASADNEPHRDHSGEILSKSDGNDADGYSGRNDGEGVHGADNAGNAESKTNRGATKLADIEPETIDTEIKSIEKKRPANKGNFVITNDIATEFDNTPPSAKDNIEAIELLLNLENEGRAATAEEKKILAKYKGWGGIDTRYLPYELSGRFDELFDYNQRKAMQSSQNNAFFTPTKVIDAMYGGLKRMGFKGGNVLETSMGIGNFFGRMPAAMSSKSALTGIELESYTARIAQYLYPGATVINSAFQDVAIKNGSYDLVIGNVPFGQNKISYNKKKYSLHNYFIVSSLDKIKDNGILAVITSASTLESYRIDARNAIMDRADVVACYKLPEKVFSRNASTDVQTDLLILRKRANGAKPSGDSILNVTTTSDGLRLNEYFIKHPENILGILAKGTNAWGDITTVLDNGDFYDRLNTAMKKLPKDLISGKIDLKPIETIVSLSDKPKFFEKNGKVYSDDGAGTATQITKREQTVRDYIAVRDAYKELLGAYDRDLPEEEIKPLRATLSKVYDTFYKNHTAITGDGKKKIGKNKCKNNTFLEADADYYLVSGLESYDAKNNKFVKSALFEKDTLRKKRVTSADAASDALAVSLNESGRIDFARMCELTGKTEKQLAEELKGEIVLTPEGDYVLTDIYLSGNIYEKIEAVKGKSEFKEQQEMLEKVIPTPKDASSITVKLGANYINESYVEQFARETFNTSLAIKKDISGRWIIEGVRQSRYGDIVNVKYGCDAFNAVQLLEKILNDAEITATKRVGIGDKAVTVFDAEMTDIAKQKADDIRSAFEAWVFSDSKRRTDIVNTYNRTYNNYRPLDYERIAEKLSFDSMDKSLKEKLYPHQKKGIARFLFGGNILFAHGVGTGKTFEMIASVMEAKRMGIINKAAMVVPNNKLVDFKNDIAQAYPNAKVLVIDTANKKRQTMLGLVNSNDWDIVLIARTTFTKIPVSRELQAQYTAQQLEDLEMQIAMAESGKSVSRRQLKGLITQRDNFEQKLKDLNSDTKRDENSVDFEKLGIDCICVDEAHNYKSIMTPTKLDIKGLANKNNAQMANDMLMKLDYLRSIDGKIIFGTGTPITNTVSEIYNMMRMVRPDILEDAGIRSLDEWVNTFAKIETTTEIGIDNQIKTKSTQIIRSFINVSEMIGMFRQFADIVFTEDVVKNLPTAVYKDVELEGTDEHRQIEKQISETIAKTKKSDLLKVYGQLMSMADAASVDLRMLSGAESEHNIFKDYSAEELEYADSKINTMCDIVLDKYKQSSDIKGTQIIFCDKGSGSGTVYSFNLHKDIMQKLIDRGIPQDQIVIVKNQSDAQLEALYDKVNAGEVRVLIGTSQKMAEGLNVQKRVVAIHHPTVTYKPSDWEQGNARGVRAGNMNSEVEIYRYLQKNTFDSHKWQAQDRKGKMIDKALRGEAVTEMEDIGADDDGGASVDAATAMAITSGNPLVKEKIDIDKEVVRLKTLKQNYMSEVYRYQDALAKNPNLIRQSTLYAENLKQDIALKNKYGEKASVVIKGKTFEKQTDANKALSEAVKSAPKNGQYTKLGTYNEFDIMFKGDTGGMNYSLLLKGSNEYSVEYAGSGNNIARFAGVLNRLDAKLKRVQERIKTLQSDLDFAKNEVSKPFEKENDLTEALAKQKDITYRYEHYGEKNNVTEIEEFAETAEAESTDTIHGSRDIADNDSVSRWTTERIESSKDSKVNIADIIKEIRDKFGIPVATGKVTDREASGIYKDRAETIRTRIANNLPTISHELGHHLDKKYNLSATDSVEELRKAVSEEFLNNYPAKEKNSEAVAEFVRIYLKNTNDANRLCPDFYSDFISVVSKEDLKALNEIASSVNEYLSYNISERYDAAIVSSQKKEKLPFRDRWHKWYSDWVDAFHPQKEAIDYVEDVTGQTLSGKDNAYVLATNSLNAHTVANFLVCEGFRDLDGNVINAKSFIDSIAMVDSKNVNLLDKYLVLKHSLEWIAPEQEGVTAKRVFADDTLENVDEIKKQIAELEKEHPEIKTAAENLYEYQNNVLKYFVIPAGGMTKETLADLNRKYPSYVPFYRAVGKKSGITKGTFANQRSPIMRAKGSGALIISPTESIIRNTEKMVKFAMRNQVMRMWANYADTVDGFGQFMEKVAPDMIPHFTNISQQKGRFQDALRQAVSSGDDYFAVSDLFDEIFGDAVADFTPVANANKKIVTVLKDGTPSYYQVHDDAFYNSVAELSPQQTTGLLRIMNSIMQPMKLLITQNNPIFAATNALRDYGTAYMLSEINNPATFAALYVKALGGIISNSESYKQFKAMGGGHSSELSANIDNISKTLREVAQKDMGMARRLAYSTFRHPIKTAATINDAVESVPRFMEFQRTLENGGDLQEAIFNADDLTTNFKRSGRGDTAKAVNKLIMFNNAAIQGVDKTVRTLTDKNPKKRIAHLFKFVLVAVIGGLIRHFWNKNVDEEGYKNLSSYKKNNFYNYAIGDGKFVSLPKPRENAVLDSIVERILERAAGNDEAFYDFGNYLGSQLLPPMLPDTTHLIDVLHSVGGSTILGGLLDVGFNKDFKGTPIEGKYEENSPSNERYNENTTWIAYGLGQTRLARYWEMSPKKIDHLISSYTGIFGQLNKALAPISKNRRDKSIGLRNKFISDSNYSTDVLNRLCENKEKAEKAFAYSGTVDKAVEYEKNAVITSYISGMNKAIKALPEDEQRNGRAYLLKALNRWDYENTASQSNMLNTLEGSKISRDVIFDELPSSKLEWTVNKQIYVYQMTPQEYHEYIHDYLSAIENARKLYGYSTVESCEKAKEAAKDYMSEYKKTVLKKRYGTKAVPKSK